MPIWTGRVLALDSALTIASAAVATPEGLLAERAPAGERSADRLLAAVDAALAASGLSLGELDAVVVGRGPGSFTGVRIGLATALGLHQATGLPLLAASSLAAMARQAPPAAERIAVAIDALRGEWYAQRFERRGTLLALGEPEVLPASALSALDAEAWIAEERSLAALSALGPRLFAAAPLAAELALAAARGELGAPSATLPAPLYLRPPAAVTRREATARG